MANKLTREEFIRKLSTKTDKVFLRGEYYDMHTDTEFECIKGHVFPSRPNNVCHRLSCPVCSGHLTVRGINDLWTVRPDIAKLLVNKNEGYLYTEHSHAKLDFCCPNCNHISNKTISKVSDRGFSCDMCSDNITFPNKVLRYILINSNVDFVDFEYSPKWLYPQRFDGFFIKNGQSYAVEMDGGIGHGNDKALSFDIYTSLLNDQKKDQLSHENGVTIIRIGCNYTTVESRFDYIKNNIINSVLFNIIDILNINWDRCFAFASSSFVKQAADLWNDGYSSKEISNELNIKTRTVMRYLQQASKFGMCAYTTDEATRRSRGLNTKDSIPVFQYSLDGRFVARYPSRSEAYRITGINNICACVNGKQKTAGGFLWKNE